MIAVILFKIITMVRYYNADIPIVKHYPNFPNLLMRGDVTDFVTVALPGCLPFTYKELSGAVNWLDNRARAQDSIMILLYLAINKHPAKWVDQLMMKVLDSQVLMCYAASQACQIVISYPTP